MESFYRYLIIASISSIILYLVYAILLKKENNFKLIRVYLISSLIFSLILPLNHVSIDFKDLLNIEQAKIIGNENQIISNQNINDTSIIVNEQKPEILESSSKSFINLRQVLIITYLIISSILIARILFSIFQIAKYSIISEKRKHGRYTIIYITKNSIPFSFFKLIFVNKPDSNEKIEQIIEHEKIHAKQLHTIDLLLTELLVAAMWFNPFIWMYKKALQQVHEFLADEGVLNSGVDQLEYQSLLVNQAAEDRLVTVSSNFSYSLIKKRIMMMSKRKTHGRSGRKLLALIPIILLLIFSVTIFNQKSRAGENAEKVPITKKEELAIEAIESNVAENFSKNSDQDSEMPNIEKDIPKEKTTGDDKIINIPIKENKELSPEDTTPKNLLVAAVSPTNMNVLYIGVDNPVSIAVTGANMDEIETSIDNGTITGKNGNYIVRVKKKGVATITVKAGNKVVTEQMFRVKTVPDPVAMVGGKRGGTITKQELVDAKGLKVYLINFDFDMKFEVISFNISAQGIGGFVNDARQENGNTFTKEQLEIINKTQPGRKIYIEDIKAKGPDGSIRDLGSLTIRIK